MARPQGSALENKKVSNQTKQVGNCMIRHRRHLREGNMFQTQNQPLLYQAILTELEVASVDNLLLGRFKNPCALYFENLEWKR